MKFLEGKLTLYLDTTIPSYVFAEDSPERMHITRRFMKCAANPAYELVISDVVIQEIYRANPLKRRLLLGVVKDLRVLPVISESDILANAYIEAGALPPSSFEDAQHVALATLYNVDALVSWNFGHLVNIRRAKAIAAINARRRLPHIEIVTPEEVLS